MLAPQAYLRISSIGITDPMGYVISVILCCVLPVRPVGIAALAMRGKDYATVQKGGGGLMKRDLRPWEKSAATRVIVLILLLVLSPHIGLALLSFGTIWSFAVLPDGYTLDTTQRCSTTSLPTSPTRCSTRGSGRAARRHVGTAIAYSSGAPGWSGASGSTTLPRPRWPFRAWCSASATCARFHDVDVALGSQPLANPGGSSS